MKERLSVSWQQHPLNLVEAINDLHDKDVFCDVTVVCDGEYFPAHRLVLCSQSDYFRELLERAPCRHPFIILRDTTAEDFDALMQFIYKGSVEVPKEKVSSLMKAGTDMKIKGLYSSEDSDDEKTMKRTKERPCVREPQCILGNIPKDKSSHKSFSRESRHGLSQSAQPADEPNRIVEPQSPSEHLNEDSGHEGHEVHYVHYTESSSSLPSDESQATVRKEVSSTKASQRHHKKRSFEMQEKTTSSSQAQNPVESSSEAKRFRFSTSEGNETSQTQDPLRGDSSQAMNILTQNIKTEMVDISDHAEGTAGEGVNPEEEHYSREPGSDDNPASPSSNAASEPLRSDITKNDLKMEDTFLEFPTELDFVFNTEETMSALQERGSSNRATITPVSSKDSVSTSNHQRSMAKEGDYGNEPSVSKYSSEGMKKVRKNRSSAEALQLATVEVIEEMEASDNEEIHDDPSSVVSTELQQPSTSGVRRKGPPLNPDSLTSITGLYSISNDESTSSDITSEESIDPETIKVLQEHHMSTLTPLIGLQAKLMMKINELRESGDYSPIVPSVSSVAYDEISDIYGHMRENSNMASELNTSNAKSPKCIGKSFKIDVEQLLEGDFNGQTVLLYYQRHGTLREAERKILTRIVTEEVLSQSRSMNRRDFLIVADDIVRVFPSESRETYVVLSGNGQPARGKLIDKYRNLKYKTTATKPKSQPISARPWRDSKKVQGEEEEEEVEDTDIQENVHWMQINTSPLEEYLQKWRSTVKYRQKKLLDKNGNDLKNNLIEWPGLKQEFAPKLIDIDFNYLYPGKGNCIEENWPAIEAKLIEHMKREFDKTSFSNMFLDNTDKVPTYYPYLALEDNIKHMTVLHLLVKIIKTNPHGSGRNRWKPTVQDSQDSFILHAQDIASMHARIQEKKTLLTSKGLTLQPLTIVVGSFTNLHSFMIYMDDNFIKCNNLLSAFGSTFKLYHVLGLKYPVECSAVYEFIQKAVFDISTKYDRCFPSVSTLLKIAK